MLRADLELMITETLEDRRLLEHPFYRRWEAGELAPGELAAYAAEYRHFESLLPEVLETIVAGIDDPDARALVQANLDDERGVPAPHLELFDTFAEAVGADTGAAPAPASARLVERYRDAAASGSAVGLAALVAYEIQAPAIATSKGDGLRAHYGLGPSATAFWDVHGAMDADHASWALDALAEVSAGTPDPVVGDAVRSAADAWWAFLDEREALAGSFAAA
jgi:pyrroloquinoline-quinone synthase